MIGRNVRHSGIWMHLGAIGHFGVSAWHYVHADKFLPTLREGKKSISDFHWSVLLKFCINRSGINHIEEIIRQEGSFSCIQSYLSLLLEAQLLTGV